MATPTYIPLANITLSGSDSTIVFQGIPSTYKDLVIIASFTAPTASLRGKFNNDATSNAYQMTRFFAFSGGLSGGSFQGTEFEFGDMTPGPAFARIQISNYSANDRAKITLSSVMSGTDRNFYHANNWNNGSVINRIDLYTNGGPFSTGDTFALYGIEG
jgi:hypothetical protein